MLEVIVIFVGVAACAWHGLGWVGSAVERAWWRGDVRTVSIAARCRHAGIDAGHAEAVRTRKSSRKAVAVVVLWRSRGLTVRWLAVSYF